MPVYTFATGVPSITPAVYSVGDTETDLNETPTATAANGVLTLTLDVGDYYAEWRWEGDTHHAGGEVANPAGVQSLGEFTSGGSSPAGAAKKPRLVIEAWLDAETDLVLNTPYIIKFSEGYVDDIAYDELTALNQPDMGFTYSYDGSSGDFVATEDLTIFYELNCWFEQDATAAMEYGITPIGVTDGYLGDLTTGTWGAGSAHPVGAVSGMMSMPAGTTFQFFVMPVVAPTAAPYAGFRAANLAITRIDA